VFCGDFSIELARKNDVITALKSQLDKANIKSQDLEDDHKSYCFAVSEAMKDLTQVLETKPLSVFLEKFKSTSSMLSM